MNSRKVEHYRQQLVSLGERLKVDLSGLADEALRTTGGEASGSLSNMPLHLADLGSDSFEHEMTMNLLETEGQAFAEVADALNRIEQGTFGICELCEKEIAAARLEALPHVRHCIHCAHEVQDAAEQAGVRMGYV